MKTSTKFWLIILGLVFIGLQFTEWFREVELFGLQLLLILYISFCFVSLYKVFTIYKKEEIEIHRFNILYWIICLPISKFNNWLNSL